MIVVNCETLFQKSDLMLLDWSRFDDGIHAKGLHLLVELVDSPESPVAGPSGTPQSLGT